MTQLGLLLKEQALDHSKRGREHRIAAVRDAVCCLSRVARSYGETYYFTADDVWEAAKLMGYTEGDTRWLGNICRGWDEVQKTDRVVNSRLPQRHARPVAIWKFR